MFAKSVPRLLSCRIISRNTKAFILRKGRFPATFVKNRLDWKATWSAMTKSTVGAQVAISVGRDFPMQSFLNIISWKSMLCSNACRPLSSQEFQMKMWIKIQNCSATKKIWKSKTNHPRNPCLWSSTSKKKMSLEIFSSLEFDSFDQNKSGKACHVYNSHSCAQNCLFLEMFGAEIIIFLLNNFTEKKKVTKIRNLSHRFYFSSLQVACIYKTDSRNGFEFPLTYPLIPTLRGCRPRSPSPIPGQISWSLNLYKYKRQSIRGRIRLTVFMIVS